MAEWQANESGRYAHLHDDELERCVLEMDDLMPEVLPDLRAELASRDLRDLARAVEIHMRGQSAEEVMELVRWVSALPCPVCGADTQPVNGCQFWQSAEHHEFVLACVPCLEAHVANRKRSLLKDLLTGGFLEQIRIHALNEGQLSEARSVQPSQALLDHVSRHRARLAVAKERGAL